VLAYDCSGKSFDTIEDSCRASYIEVVTSDQGPRRIYDGDTICFLPPERAHWTWYCRGYEEGQRCRTNREGNVAVSATMQEGRVLWNCYQQ